MTPLGDWQLALSTAPPGGWEEGGIEGGREGGTEEGRWEGGRGEEGALKVCYVVNSVTCNIQCIIVSSCYHASVSFSQRVCLTAASSLSFSRS